MVLVTSGSGRPCEGYDAPSLRCLPLLGVPVVWSFVYLALRHVLELIMLCCRSTEAKEVEILVLRQELAVLRRQHRRLRLQPKDRALLAALSRQLPRAHWSVFLVKPETLPGWHRRMVRRRWTYVSAPRGRPSVPGHVQQLIVRLARDNLGWGYQRNRGELLRLGCQISASSIRRVLRGRPGPMRPGVRGTGGRRPRCRAPRPRSRPRARVSPAGCRAPSPGHLPRTERRPCLGVGAAWFWECSHQASVTRVPPVATPTEPLDAPATALRAAAAQQRCTTNPHEPPRIRLPYPLMRPATRGVVVGAVVGIPRWHARNQCRSTRKR
jgi:hypothetical protein